MRVTTFDLVQPFDGPSDFNMVWEWLLRHFESPWPDTSLEQSKACGFQHFSESDLDTAKSDAIVSQPLIPFSFITVRKNVPESMVEEELEKNLKGGETDEEQSELRRRVHIALLEQALPEKSVVDCAINLATNRVYICTGSAGTVSDFEVVWNMNAANEMGKVYLRDFDRILALHLTEENARWFKAVDPQTYGSEQIADYGDRVLDDPDLDGSGEPEKAYKYDCAQDFLLAVIKDTDKDEELCASFSGGRLEIMRGKAASFANRGKGRCTVRAGEDFWTSEAMKAVSVGKKPDWLGLVAMVEGVQAEIKLDKALTIKAFKLIQDKEHPDKFDYESERLALGIERFEAIRAAIETAFCAFVDIWIDETPQTAIAEWSESF